MRIAVDAMGGDRAPREVVVGALDAAQRLGVEVCFVGDRGLVEEIVREVSPPSGTSMSFHHAPDTIGMDERGTARVRQASSSIGQMVRLVERGEAEAAVSAGNTGAVVSAAVVRLGRIRHVDRPAIATRLPSINGHMVCLDMGATVDCKPHHLLQFAHMGRVYSRDVLGHGRPRIGLLNIGSEPGKGNELVKSSHELLAASQLDFVGNVEGNEMFRSRCDVLVCDGFVGNMILKTAEGAAEFVLRLIQQQARRNLVTKVRGIVSAPIIRGVIRTMTYEEVGGAMLLGVNGVCVICHGRSTAAAISNAVGVAQRAVEQRIVARIEESVEEWMPKSPSPA